MNLLSKLNRNADALILLDEGLHAEPQNWKLLTKKGRILQEMGEIDQARENASGDAS